MSTSFALAYRTLSTVSHFGQLLKTARKRHKMTHAVLAGYVGVSQNRLSHLENHPEEISVNQLLNWCAALELEFKLGERDTPAASSSAEWSSWDIARTANYENKMVSPDKCTWRFTNKGSASPSLRC